MRKKLVRTGNSLALVLDKELLDELGIEAVGSHERDGLRLILWKRLPSHGWSAYDRATDDSPQVHVIRVPKED